jgi:hypothetical protein
MRIYSVFYLFCLGLSSGLWAAAAPTDPMVLAPSDDTYLSPGHDGLPAGRGVSKELQVYGGADQKQYRALLKFDVSAVKQPPTQAMLRLFIWNIGTPPKVELIRCHPMLRAWDEKFASWDCCLEDDKWFNEGGDFDPTPAAGCNVSKLTAVGQWIEFDVTALVQAWVLKRRLNQGVAVFFEPEILTQIRVRSKENGENAPELKLAWNAKIDRGVGLVMGEKMKPYGKPVKMEPEFSTASLTIARRGVEFSQKIEARGGVRPFKFTAVGLPSGVKLSPEGDLSGTVDKVCKVSIQFAVTGADGKRTTKSLEFVVQEPNNEPKKPDAPKKPEQPQVPIDE